MKILVRFRGDNDFGLVLLAFGDLVLRRLSHCSEEGLTAEIVARWFNELAPTFYEMLLGSFKDAAALAKARAYLRIKPEDVYLQEAADKKMETWGSWGNSDSVLIDSALVQHPVCLV